MAFCEVSMLNRLLKETNFWTIVREPLMFINSWLLTYGKEKCCENVRICLQGIECHAISPFQEWANRADLPSHVVTMLNNLPEKVHPMAQFSAAITACNSESKFARAYSEGVKKTTYWEVRRLSIG